jgi:hypothetical protein
LAEAEALTASTTPDEHRKSTPVAMDQGLVDMLTLTIANVEWSTLDKGCPRCWAPAFRGHYDGCQLDAALTRVGLDTKEKRDEYRRRARKE